MFTLAVWIPVCRVHGRLGHCISTQFMSWYRRYLDRNMSTMTSLWASIGHCVCTAPINISHPEQMYDG